MEQQVTSHFSYAELVCKCGCGRMETDPAFLAKLEDLRVAFGKPMTVTSGYRCPRHNAEVSHTGTAGPHTIGAADIAVSGEDAYTLVQLAMACGFSGIGIKQSGDFPGRFVHLDNLPFSWPRPRIWTY